MNRTISKIATSLMGLLSHTEKLSDSTLDNRCEDIREEMLRLLEHCGTQGMAPTVANKVFHARNIEALWYMRSAIMVELSRVFDESEAHAMLVPVTNMFKGFLPESLAPRARTRPGANK